MRKIFSNFVCFSESLNFRQTLFVEHAVIGKKNCEIIIGSSQFGCWITWVSIADTLGDVAWFETLRMDKYSVSSLLRPPKWPVFLSAAHCKLKFKMKLSLMKIFWTTLTNLLVGNTFPSIHALGEQNCLLFKVSCSPRAVNLGNVLLTSRNRPK